MYAVSDEWHQSFVPTRVGTPWDVLIDAAGAALGLSLAGLWWRWRRSR
jgi:VanZ family protein